MKAKRVSWFITIFGTFLGLVAIGYGAVTLFLQPSAPVLDCGAKCATERALFGLLGQPLYNLIFGLVWVAIGLIVIITVIRAWRRRA